MNIPALCRCAIVLAVLCTLPACGGSVPSASESAAAPLSVKKKAYQDLVVGFAQIGAESEYLHGTCVSLVIPLQRAPAFRAAVALGAH